MQKAIFQINQKCNGSNISLHGPEIYPVLNKNVLLLIHSIILVLSFHVVNSH